MTTPRPKHAPFGSISLNKDAGPPTWATSKSTGAIPTTTKPFPSPTDSKDKFMRGHRSTFSNTVNSLLQRGISQTKDTKHGHQHTMSADKISGPVFMRSDEPLSQRSGPLGSGATVVRTPNEALKDSGVRLEHSREEGLPRIQQNDHEEDEERLASPSRSPAVPSSPPLPPLPAFDSPEDYLEEEDEDEEEGDRNSQLSEQIPASAPISMNMSSLARAATSTPPLRPSLKVRSMPITADDFPPVPPLPIRVQSVPPTPLQPNFNAIVTASASGYIDSSNLIIALETSTQTYRTTYSTLTSRPSLLSEYIVALCSQSAIRAQDPDTSSFYSTEEPSEDYIDAYRHHLASQGLLSPTKSMKLSPSTPSQISLFLDRPSSPYSLILDYLRSPLPPLPASSMYTAAGASDPLPPRAHRISIDALLEVRDEAAYLGLQSLRDLIVEELKIRNTLGGPRQHTSALHHRRGRSTGGNNSSGVASLRASVYSSHSSSSPALLLDTGSSKGDARSRTNTPFSEASTLNNVPDSESPMQYHCGGADSKHTSSTSLAPPPPMPLPIPFVQRTVRAPPTPQSWVNNEYERSESRSRNRSRDPPAGWI